MSGGARHGLALRGLHWATAGLILAQVVLAGLNATLYAHWPIFAEWAVQAHMSLGAVTFLIVLVRLAVRIGWPGQLAPAVPTGWPRFAKAVHLSLYLCLLLLPVFGYLRVAAL